MNVIPFLKVQGTGNDFVLIDGRVADHDWPALARQMCDRHFGVGADGLLVAQNSPHAPIRMAMYNPDGSLAEMCGNGLRCFVKWAVERGGVPVQGDALDVDTGAGVLRSTFAADRPITRVRVDMGRPRLDPADVPVAAEGRPPILNLPLRLDGADYPVTCVSMGNPHAVHFTDTPVDTLPLERLGPLAEHDPHFPQRTNFEIVNPLDAGHLRARVWERGAGLTLACGTGAAAILVAARLRGLVGDRATVSLPGGDLLLEWDGHGAVHLEGPAAGVFEGEWPLHGHA